MSTPSSHPSVISFTPAWAFGFLLTLISLVSSSSAAVLYYDGFVAGGAGPVSGLAYISSPDSTNGINNNSLVRSVDATVNGQMPATPGFSTGTLGGWKTLSGMAATVYGRVQGTTLTYSGLNTGSGSVNIFRSGSNSAEQTKTITRDFATNLGSTASSLYFSTLVNFDSGVSGALRINQGTALLGFGFDSAGKVIVFEGVTSTSSPSNILATSTASYTAGSTYLLVAHVYDTNKVDIWLNPSNLSNEASSSGQKILSGVSLTSFQAGTALSSLGLVAQTGNNLSSPDFQFDELRGATTWGEVFNAVPEPSRAILLMLGTLAFCLRRRRQYDA